MGRSGSATRSLRLGWRASTSCAALALAGAIMVGTPLFKPSPAQAQFGIGGFHIRIGGYRWHHHGGRHSRYSRRHRRQDDDTPEPDTGPPSSRPATTTAPADSGRGAVRPAAAQPDSRQSSGSARPEPRGPDLEPAK